MTFNSARLVLAFAWFAWAGYLFFVQAVPGRFGPYVGWFAVLLGLYNLARWNAGRFVGLPPPPPHRRRRDHDRPPPQLNEYHPEFDFDKDS